MRTAICIFLLFLLTAGTHAQTMDTANFKSERVTKTASIAVNGDIKNVFPLFGAFEERKWAKGWNPTLIYPATETIEEGTTFKTPGHLHGEQEYVWRVSKYDNKQFLIQYMVYARDRCWTITVSCNALLDHKTSATITYSFVGLSEMGNEMNRHSIGVMYRSNLKDWEEEINNYLKGLKAD
ncbi:MAG TPA: hypothetical protein VL727_14050 [Puia sp.]|nr:hypothetical protein [Puia sp.]